MTQTNVRDKIIEAGLEVIHAQGFNDCSVQDITDAAGVPKGSFYNYFKSKEALAVEVLSVYRGSGDLDCLQDRSKSPVERLRAHFRASARPFLATGFRRGCLMGSLGAEMSDSSEPVRKALTQRFKVWHQAIATLLRDGQSTGDVDGAIDPEQAARFLVSSWEGALLQMKISKSAQPIDDFLELALVPLFRR
jgi:TetR/AcrR family transcriptional repressor of nem operon